MLGHPHLNRYLSFKVRIKSKMEETLLHQPHSHPRYFPIHVALLQCLVSFCEALHYKADGSQISRLELQHKTCSDSKAVSDGFEGVRDGAFAAVVSGVMGGNGFCDMSYESMHVTAQCQGNLESCDCGECVANAVQIAQDECGESISGEVYLDSCFMIYSYNGINEIPGNSNGGFGTRNIASGKLVAIVGGVAVAAAFVLFFFYFCKSIIWRSRNTS